jgi:hypothetical protein
VLRKWLPRIVALALLGSTSAFLTAEPAASDVGTADFVMTLDGPDTGQVGETLMYTATLTNRGPDQGDGQIRMAFETKYGVELVPSDYACPMVVGTDMDSFNCPSVTMAAGAVIRFYLFLRVTSVVPTVVDAIAGWDNVVDPDTTNNAISRIILAPSPSPSPPPPPPPPIGPPPAAISKHLTTTDPILPDSTYGQPIDIPLLLDGTGPFKLQVTSGYLPNGVHFRASDGHLVGSPLESGFLPFNALFTDSLGATGGAFFRWNIEGGPPIADRHLPNPYLTPGATDRRVKQTTIRQTICAPAWVARVRPPASYTSALELTQMNAYQESDPPSGYEEDHLIPLELGGAPRDPKNLWPEKRPRAGEVDKIEVALARQVCLGTISLAAARRKIIAIKRSHG